MTAIRTDQLSTRTYVDGEPLLWPSTTGLLAGLAAIALFPRRDLSGA
jgi:hypothetical protein